MAHREWPQRTGITSSLGNLSTIGDHSHRRRQSQLSRDASASAGKLSVCTRDAVIGRQLDDFTPPGLKPQVCNFGEPFFENRVNGRRAPTGSQREVEYIAKSNVFVRHALWCCESNHTCRRDSRMGTGLRVVFAGRRRGASHFGTPGRRRIISGRQEALHRHITFAYPGRRYSSV